MKYFEFTFHTSPCTETVNDVLTAVLGEVGFAIKTVIAEFPLSDTEITYTFTEAEDKDWNEEWEKNFFQPIIIGDRCVIHSTFHQNVPKAEYDIVINPQMAFGTPVQLSTSMNGVYAILSRTLN